eukprot:Gregarina_sp_Pseudo_9__2891@NODE_3111_length_749_cov_10_301408_g2837_i0_p1_GENE_NODE_3111_length_749_cov_10_301408_g2837_i0NODE_3111_length_749_cov_10_301408_g2837_i0_p1_ORF_typecomplete_len213_score6_37_NODE_3111_length_749_cov_10_301408_g2837_i070708
MHMIQQGLSLFFLVFAPYGIARASSFNGATWVEGGRYLEATIRTEFSTEAQEDTPTDCAGLYFLYPNNSDVISSLAKPIKLHITRTSDTHHVLSKDDPVFGDMEVRALYDSFEFEIQVVEDRPLKFFSVSPSGCPGPASFEDTANPLGGSPQNVASELALRWFITSTIYLKPSTILYTESGQDPREIQTVEMTYGPMLQKLIFTRKSLAEVP